MDTTLPTRLGPYQVLKRLGGGGFAEVLLARDTSPKNYGTRVAIKRLRNGLLQRDPVFLDSLLYEAEIGMMVNSGHVVRVECVLDIEGEPIIVMEYIEGFRLDQLVRLEGESALPIEAAAEITRQLCAGLEAVHQACDAGGELLGAVHQDVKPANVMVTTRGVVKLLDLGLARPQRKELSSLWIRQGTPGYRSPEQSEGEAVLTAASDLYSVGVILHEMLQGRRLFPDADRNPEALRERQRQISINSEIVATRVAPPGLDNILQKLLAFEPADRYQSAIELAHELGRWQKAWNSHFDLTDYLNEVMPNLASLPQGLDEPSDIHCQNTQPGVPRGSQAAPVSSQGMSAVAPAASESALSGPGVAASSVASVPGVARSEPGIAPRENTSRSTWLRRFTSGFSTR